MYPHWVRLVGRSFLSFVRSFLQILFGIRNWAIRAFTFGKLHIFWSDPHRCIILKLGVLATFFFGWVLFKVLFAFIWSVFYLLFYWIMFWQEKSIQIHRKNERKWINRNALCGVRTHKYANNFYQCVYSIIRCFLFFSLYYCYLLLIDCFIFLSSFVIMCVQTHRWTSTLERIHTFRIEWISQMWFHILRSVHQLNFVRLFVWVCARRRWLIC